MIIKEEGVQEQSDVRETPHEDTGKGSAFEGVYDRLPNISIKALDRFILLCVLGLVAVVATGILRANHVF